MYSTQYCGFCRSAKQYLKQVKNVTVEEIDLSADPQRRAELAAETGHRTVPLIFIGERFVGGYDDLRNLDRNGELDTLLNA
jgi:glutaredoxin 3